MKCPNCGFNCDDKYCAMCGTKMPEQAVYKNPNPYEISSAYNNNFQSENINQPNTPDFSAGFGNPNPYNQPQPPVNNANSYPNMPQGGMPVPPPYPAPPLYNNAPKKKSKALPIILTCLIAAVIVAGAVISVYSACTYNKSIITDLVNDASDDYYTDDEYDYTPDMEYIQDEESHKIGETKELPDCKVTLKRVEKDKSAEENKTGNSRTRYVLEIENTTDKYISLYYVYYDVYADNYNYFDWLSDNLEKDGNDNYFIDLKPNEKKEITFDYSVPNDAEKIEIYLSFTGYEDAYNYSGTFVAE